jgi:hypothetical protein
MLVPTRSSTARSCTPRCWPCAHLRHTHAVPYTQQRELVLIPGEEAVDRIDGWASPLGRRSATSGSARARRPSTAACRTSTSRGPFSARPRSAPPSSSSAGQGLATGPTRQSHAIHGGRLPDRITQPRSSCLVAFSCFQLTPLSRPVLPQLEAAHATVMKATSRRATAERDV